MGRRQNFQLSSTAVALLLSWRERRRLQPSRRSVRRERLTSALCEALDITSASLTHLRPEEPHVLSLAIGVEHVQTTVIIWDEAVCYH